MIKARIESIGVSLPSKEMFFKKGSIKHAVNAGKECLKNSKYNPHDIEIIINTGIHRDYHLAEPAIASILQYNLNINPEFQGKKTFSFDLLNSRCGMLTGIYTLTALFQSGKARVGLVISSETNTDKNPDPSYKYKDSGVCVLLDISPKNNIGFGNFIFNTYEEYIDLYESAIDITLKRGKIKIQSKNEELEQVFLNKIPEVIGELLEKEKLNKNEIDFIISSQISKNFLDNLSSKIQFSKEKIVNIVDLYGDTLTTSLFLGYNYILKEGKLKNGNKILFLGLGTGITIGATIYYF